jgi:hypothetical protein
VPWRSQSTPGLRRWRGPHHAVATSGHLCFYALRNPGLPDFCPPMTLSARSERNPFRVQSDSHIVGLDPVHTLYKGVVPDGLAVASPRDNGEHAPQLCQNVPGVCRTER